VQRVVIVDSLERRPTFEHFTEVISVRVYQKVFLFLRRMVKLQQVEDS